ncbi:MAG: N-acetylmuramoyl-L-alanine amidase, partial [Synergistaceae bacterium]|nr:N-acetylmuramoyl-L-alanine amidase [Synergistaceae bacterium]
AQSAAVLFQTVAGRGVANRLRFARIEGYNASSIISRDFGGIKADAGEVDVEAIMAAYSPRASKPKPKQVQPVAAAETPQPSPPVQAAEPEEPVQTVQPTEPEEPAEPVEQVQQEEQKEPQESDTVLTASQQETWEELKASLSDEKPKVQEPETVADSTPEKPLKPQPRHETFKLGENKSEKPENYHGTIQGVRWTSNEGAAKKIRAVVLAEEESDPQVFMLNDQLHALFSSSLENSKGIASPFPENVKAELKRNSDGIDLVFTPTGITKAEKIVLNNPRRIVFEFSYPEEADITETQAEQPESEIQLPGQVTEPEPQPVTPKTEPQPKPESKPQKPDPVLSGAPVTIKIPTSPAAAASKGRKTIVIDPGHGGKDPGAIDNGVKEKDVNLAVGLELQRQLSARGYNAVLTRATDIYLKLQERTDIANNLNADLFVSIHVNALPSKKSMTGFEIYIMALPTDKDAMNLAKIENREYVEGKGMDSENVDRRTEMLLRILGDMQQNNKISESTEFAAALYNSGVRNNLPMRRVAQAPFFVLRGAGMPAVLLEIGFVTNETESQMLMTQPYQQKIAAAMADGIANYIKK